MNNGLKILGHMLLVTMTGGLWLIVLVVAKLLKDLGW